MTTKRQRGAAETTFPLWVRSLALACLLLVGAVSTAQVAHIHGDWLPKHDTHLGAPADASQTPGDEEHCPLCVAMHSALPISQPMEPVQVELVAVLPPAAALALPASVWHYAMFSRPPPALIS